MIKIDKINKSFKKGNLVLNEVEFNIDKGMFGLLGPNGAGKTTLIRILATLIKPTSGDIIIDGVCLSKDPEKIRQIIGYLPQTFQLYPQLTGYEFLDYVGGMKGIKKADRKKKIEEILEDVNLSSKSKDKVKTYSGGMLRRLGIAQALIGDPSVVLVDEPTVGLDPEERVRFRNLLSKISLNRTIILSTHIVSDIESTCQRVGVLNKGLVVFNGNIKDLKGKAEGKVWEVEIFNENINFLKDIQIVSVKQQDNGMVYRVISNDKPNKTAKPMIATLEDGYLALIGGKRDE